MNRVEAIDFAKGIAIMAVTLGHILGAFQLKNSLLLVLICSFELPLFFLVKGYLGFSIQKQNVTLKGYVCKQARSILLPYIEFSILYMLIPVMAKLFHSEMNLFSQLRYDFVITITGIGLGVLWFLPTFFIASIITPPPPDSKRQMYKRFIYCSMFCIIAAILSYFTEKYRRSDLMSWNILAFFARCIVGASLILIGQLLAAANLFIIRNKLITLLLLLLGGVIGLTQSTFVDLHFSIIHNPLIFYFSAITTTLGITAVGTAWRPRCVLWLGKNSLYIMFFQFIIGYWCRVINVFVDFPSSSVFTQYAIVFVSLAGVLLIAAFITNIMLRCNLFYKWRK